MVEDAQMPARVPARMHWGRRNIRAAIHATTLVMHPRPIASLALWRSTPRPNSKPKRGRIRRWIRSRSQGRTNSVFGCCVYFEEAVELDVKRSGLRFVPLNFPMALGTMSIWLKSIRLPYMQQELDDVIKSSFTQMDIFECIFKIWFRTLHSMLSPDESRQVLGGCFAETFLHWSEQGTHRNLRNHLIHH